jgi:hypothetical protein
MNNRIEEAQEDEKAQEEIEFEHDINENPNFVEPQVTSKRHTNASSGESQIEKPKPETEQEDLASTVEGRADSPSVSSAVAPQPNQEDIQSSSTTDKG